MLYQQFIVEVLKPPLLINEGHPLTPCWGVYVETTHLIIKAPQSEHCIQTGLSLPLIRDEVHLIGALVGIWWGKE